MSAALTAPVAYRITPSRPAAHLFKLLCRIAAPDPAGQRLSLPAWIPGSYMVREFARNIVSLTARADGQALALTQLDKASWQVAPAPAGSVLELEYEVYAWDLSVRTAHLDQNHGFFNGTSVFLAVGGQTAAPCLVELCPPEGEVEGEWQVATALPRAEGEAGCAAPFGFGLYRAADYDELVDHPVEMGAFTRATFTAHGVPHHVILTGRHDCDLERLCADLKPVCEWQIGLFGQPAPMREYYFLTMVVGDGYGGLEHRASTALLTSRKALPWKGMEGTPEDYRGFLGLCSHEYFHSWNVKRIKPAAFVPYDLSRENYTRLLWAFEGFTSYYDDLALLRSGRIATADYLEILGKTITGVLRGPGRLRQSVAASSFEAWTKYYRQDENAPNAIVSYYTKGSLVALCLDLKLRKKGSSLDAVMGALWQRHGQTGVGVPEDGIFAIARELGGKPVAEWLRAAVEGCEDLPLEALLKDFGIAWDAKPVAETPWLGVKTAAGEGGVRLAQVLDGGPALAAGLSAGDVVIAVGGLRASGDGLDAFLARRQAGDKLEIHAFRRDELKRFEVVLAPAPDTQITLSLHAARGATLERRKAWLEG